MVMMATRLTERKRLGVTAEGFLLSSWLSEAGTDDAVMCKMLIPYPPEAATDRYFPESIELDFPVVYQAH